MFKNIIIFLSCFIVAACGVGSNTTNNSNSVNNKLNFQKLYANSDFQAMEYGLYNPEKAIAACPSIPKDGIWPSPVAGEPPLPSPEPNTADCEMSAQSGYGCNDFAPGSTGDILKKSLVRVLVGAKICSGTYVAKDWVLTAAHCVTRNNKLVDVSEVAISGSSGTFGVSVIYISARFKENRYFTKYNPDWALLRLAGNNSKAVPIPLAERLTTNQGDSFMFAGFGADEHGNIAHSGNFSYRKMYYMTNMYDSSWHGGVSDNYGDIYTVSSKPVDYNGSQSAWSFIGPGDSGGPLLAYNNLTGDFEVAGVLSNNLFCVYPGFFAKLPYPYMGFTSTVYRKNYTLMRMILNGSVLSDKVKCSGDCKFEKKIYVVNQDSNSVSGYSLQFNNILEPELDPQSTGELPTRIAVDDKGDSVLVTNYMSNTISLYNLDYETNSLLKVSDNALPINQVAPVDALYLNNSEDSSKKIYVLASDANSKAGSLLSYELDDDYELKMIHKLSYFNITKSPPVHMEAVANNYGKLLLIAGETEFNAVKLLENDQVEKINLISLDQKYGEWKIIDFKAKPVSADNTKWYVYLLTTEGVYVYIINTHNISQWSQIGAYRTRFDAQDHLELLQDDSFAIGRFWGNKVELYRVSEPSSPPPELTIRLTNTIFVSSPNEIMFDKVNDKEDYLYITVFPRELYRYRLYPNLSTSATPEIFRTGENPTAIVKTRINNCGNEYECFD